ncbi:MAG TPA: response regulator [Thermoanaerobaculia bacterium]|nr:response regulator [Thermoanaerobaculia bacterium]
MSKTILLADDSVTIQKVIELTFMDEDYEVIAAGDGDEALDKLEQVSPDVVIADVHMPGASGFDVAKRSKQLHPGAPVLLLVGTFEPFDDADYKGSGADSFLKKPFDSQELLQRVTQLLADGPSESPAAAPAAAPATDTADTAPPPLPDLPSPTPSPAAPPAGGDSDFDAAATRAVPSMARTESVQPASSPPAAGEPTSGHDPFPELTQPRPTVDEDDVFGFDEADGSSQVLPPVEPVEDEAPLLDDSPLLDDGDDDPGFVLDDDESQGDESHGEFTLASDDDPAAGGSEPQAVPSEETAPSGVPGPAASNGAGRVDLSDADVDRIARRVVDLLGDQVVREVAWEVVPDLAEVAVRDRLAQLEGQVEEG